MGVTRKEIFTETQNELAEVAKVLGHPARIAILQYVALKEECICGDLVNEIGLAQATISQHLRELKGIGILQGTVEGNRVCYCINSTRWKEIQSQLAQFFKLNTTKINCC